MCVMYPSSSFKTIQGRVTDFILIEAAHPQPQSELLDSKQLGLKALLKGTTVVLNFLT